MIMIILTEPTPLVIVVLKNKILLFYSQEILITIYPRMKN